MKIVIALIVSLFFSIIISCSTTQNLTGKKVLKTEQEIDSVFSIMVKAAENLDVEKLKQGVDDRYQIGFITNGRYYAQFDSLMDNFSTRSRNIVRQSISFQNKKITLLSATLAALTASGESRVEVADGRTFTVKFFWSFIYARINDQWKVIHSHQSQ